MANLLGVSHQPPDPKAVLDALSDPALCGLLGQEDVQSLLGAWAPRTLYRSSVDYHLKDQVVCRLMKMGANPWEIEDTVKKWVEHGADELVKQTFELFGAAPLPALSHWAKQAVEKGSGNMLRVLVESGADIKRGDLLAAADNERMVRLLCELGADMNAPCHGHDNPLSAWNHRAGSTVRKRQEAGALACAAASQYVASGQDLLGSGFAQLPYLASFYSTPKATLYGQMGRGFEAVDVAGHLRSPLFGWSFMLLNSNASPPSRRQSVALLRQCFKAREGILDDEWFYAAAAAVALENKSGRDAGRVNWMIQDRIQELSSLPSLEKEEGSRWQDVLDRVVKIPPSKYVMNISHEVSEKSMEVALHMILRKGCGGIPFGSTDHMEQLIASAARLRPAQIKTVSEREWGHGIPEGFWETNGFVAPAWMEATSPLIVGRDLSRRLTLGQKMPRHLVPNKEWPPDLLAWHEAEQIASQTPVANKPPARARRM